MKRTLGAVMTSLSTGALVTSLVLAASLLLAPTPPPAFAHACEVNGQTVTLRPFSLGDAKVELCHGTGSSTNPYVVIDVDVSGACGHYREHLLERPPRVQNPDIFPEGFLANVGTLCST